jgi:hypothetical protein
MSYYTAWKLVDELSTQAVENMKQTMSNGSAVAGES